MKAGTMQPSTLFYCWILIKTLLSAPGGLIAAASTSDNGLEHEVNICTNQEELRCPDGHIISIEDVTCGGQGHACVTGSNQSVHDICHGHQTCSNVGLRGMFVSRCDSHASGVNCRFKCVPGTSAKCRTNICARDSPGLICPPGSAIHIRLVTCSDQSPECSWGSYNLISSLCEQSGQCEASGLRALLSSYCRGDGDTDQQVMLDYLCVPAKLVYNSCSSYRYRPIGSGFGVLRSPKKKKSEVTNKQCKWMVAPRDQNPIRVNVMLVQSQATHTGCNPNFLRIQLMSCKGEKEKKVTLMSFCNLRGSSVHLTSCGPIKITSSPFAWGSGNNDFIVSFENFPQSADDGFLSSGLSSCLAPPPPVPSVLTLPSKTDRTHKALHTPVPDDSVTEGSSTTGSFTLSLQMLLVFIFLGTLIIILVAALITVLVRYHRLPRHKYGDNAENVILWKRYEDTAMDIFQQNGLMDHTTAINQDTQDNSDQVIATVHRDPLPDQEDQDNRISVGSGISSFLPLKRDSGFKDLLESFQLGSYPNYTNNDTCDNNGKSPSQCDYYELPEKRQSQDFYQSIDTINDPHLKGHYSNPNSLSRPPKSTANGYDEEQHFVDIEHHKPLVAPDIYPRDSYHYCVNNDEYAVVNKSRGPAKSERYHSDAKSRTPNGVDNSCVSVNFRPTSGPYDKINSPTSNSSHRRSNDMMWREDL